MLTDLLKIYTDFAENKLKSVQNKNEQTAWMSSLHEFQNNLNMYFYRTLRLYKDQSEEFPSRLPDITRPLPIVRESNEQMEWEVDRIVDHRYRGKGKGKNKRLEYLVLWKGYPDYERTWQKEIDLKNAPTVIKDYWTTQNGSTL